MDNHIARGILAGTAIVFVLGGCWGVARSHYNSLAPLLISVCLALPLLAISSAMRPKRASATKASADHMVRRKPARVTVIPSEPLRLPSATLLPDVLPNPRRQFEQPIVKAINDVWRFCTAHLHNAAQYSMDIRPAIWNSSTVIFPLKLTRSLRTPEHDMVVMRRFAPALVDVLVRMARSESNRAKARLTTVSIEDGLYHVTIRKPGKAPDLHISKMLQYAKPGRPLGKADRTGDIFGLLGVNRKDELVYLDFALTPVSLFVGKTGSGKTSAAMGMLTSLLSANSPNRVHLYVAAFRANQWRDFARLPHVQAVEYEPGRIAALCQRLADEAQQRAGIDSDNSHPSAILFVDDLSGISKMDAWPAIRDALTQITMSGGGARYYTIITTHRTTESGGVGTGARAITLNAGARIAFNTQGGPSIMADHLGVPQTQAENIPVPKAREEAAISFDSEPPFIIRTVYALGHEVNNVINIANQPTAGVKESVNGANAKVESTATLHKSTTPLERNGYTNDCTESTPIHQDYTESTRYIPADVRREVHERDNEICQWCGGEGDPDRGPDGETWELDHVVPVSRGGTNDAENLVLSCRTCNRRKGAMTGEEFVKSELLALNGRVPVVRKVRGRYATSAWDNLQLWAANQLAGLSISDIAQIALGRKGSHQNKKVEQFIRAGQTVYNAIREMAGD